MPLLARFLPLFAFSLTAIAAEPEPLVKAGSYHLKTERFGAAAVAEGNFVYIIAGANRGGLLGDIERFDATTHEVTRLTDKLAARRDLGAVLIDGRIFIFGGASYEAFGGADVNSAGRPSPTVEIYDLASGKLSQAAPMPHPRISPATAAWHGKAYLIGGVEWNRNRIAQSAVTEIYDPATNAWTSGTPLPTPRSGVATVVGDFIIVPGGVRGGTNVRVAKVEFYLPQDNSWKILPDLCEPASAASVAFLGNHLFLFGNYGGESHVIAYDLRTRTSRLIKPGYKSARNTAAVTLGDQIYVIGGMPSAEGDVLDDIQVFKPAS